MNSVNIKLATHEDVDTPNYPTSIVAKNVSSERVKSLSDIMIGERCVVRQLIAPSDMPEWQTQLEDIGFIAGEPVTLMARGALGGDPMVIRIGLSTFALRKAEAACVLVDVLQDKVAA